MRLIKAVLAGATGLFVIITLFSLLIPSNVRVSRAVIINNSSVGEVYPQIMPFKNWKNWHPIFTTDSVSLSANPPEITGNDSGCIIRHRGKEVRIRLISADSSSVKFLMQASGENDIENDIVITALPVQQAVQVEWRSITRLHWYPWEKFYGIFIDKLSGPGYEAALNGLRDYIESPRSPKGGT